jgi:hypothetical protein
MNKGKQKKKGEKKEQGKDRLIVHIDFNHITSTNSTKKNSTLFVDNRGDSKNIYSYYDIR